MTQPCLYQFFARYNAAMNARLYAVCEGLDDAARKADRGAFFGSIHATLDHILLGDDLWMWRFTGGERPPGAIGTQRIADFDALRAAREAMDQRILDWTAGLEPAWLQGSLTWTSADGQTRSQARWRLVSHMFNHQTHHRGQVTALLSQLGIDYGRTDMPWFD
ncbi:MAG: damage-inducible protein DinB [Alphaproteobacteria bacterium]|nr:MAG: damage-inducible protein DinB [Alphaproteobacteria bacterium]